ncbi:MAG: polysaccharide deacetylase family protein [Burkholderiaceae bacterium]
MLIDSALKIVLSRLAPAGPNARLTVLIFHRVLAVRDPLRPNEPTVAEFAEILDWVKRWFNVLPLSEAITRLRSDSLPARSLAITFDDGYADNHHLALPELQRRGLSATFFVATGYLDGGRMFNDTVIEAVRGCRSETLDLSDLGLGVHHVGNDDERRAAIASLLPKLKKLHVDTRLERAAKIAARCGARLPEDLMMTSEEVAKIADAGMELGGHTDRHPILASLPEAAARSEIERGRRRLQDITGCRIGLFAYPNGRMGTDYTAATRDLVRALGFDAALSTMHGVASRQSSMFDLPRFTPWDRSRLRFGLRLARNALQAR